MQETIKISVSYLLLSFSQAFLRFIDFLLCRVEIWKFNNTLEHKENEEEKQIRLIAIIFI